MYYLPSRLCADPFCYMHRPVVCTRTHFRCHDWGSMRYSRLPATALARTQSTFRHSTLIVLVSRCVDDTRGVGLWNSRGDYLSKRPNMLLSALKGKPLTHQSIKLDPIELHTDADLQCYQSMCSDLVKSPYIRNDKT